MFLDFSKAFEKISYKFILSKLHYYGIRNQTLSWIGASLSNSTQTTVVNGVHSSYVEVTSGVPQGSVLGPMLFQLHVNDINNAITSQIKLFADDSVLYINIHNQNDQVIFQNDLDTISSWTEKWLMELNINKCSVLSITLKRLPNRCWPLRGWKTRPKKEHHPTEEDGQIGTNHSLPLERGAIFNRFFGKPAHGPPHVAGGASGPIGGCRDESRTDNPDLDLRHVFERNNQKTDLI